MEEDLDKMWDESTQEIARIDPARENWKIQTLPLARVKKIMKSEEIILQELERDRLRREAEASGTAEGQEKSNVKFMISGEAPVLMSKACELLIKDLSFRAWRHTERNRRRTLQRQDLHAAVGESEVYDFLIDIVPRVNTAPQAPAATAKPPPATMNAPPPPDMSSMGVPASMLQMGMPPAAMHQHPGAPVHSQLAVQAGGPPPPTAPQHQAPNPSAPASHDVTGAPAIMGFAQAQAVDPHFDPAFWMFGGPGMASLEGNDAPASAPAVAIQGGQQQLQQHLQQPHQQRQQQQQQLQHHPQQHQPATLPIPTQPLQAPLHPQQPHQYQPPPPQQQQQQQQLQLPHSLVVPQQAFAQWTDTPGLDPSPQPPGS